MQGLFPKIKKTNPESEYSAEMITRQSNRHPPQKKEEKEKLALKKTGRKQSGRKNRTKPNGLTEVDGLPADGAVTHHGCNGV